MGDEIAVKLRFTVPMKTDGVVKIDQPFARHQLLKITHQSIGTFNRDPKIGAGKRKQNREIDISVEQRIEADAALIFVTKAKRDGQGQLSFAQDASHQIGAASAIKDTRDNLQFGLRIFRLVHGFNSRRSQLRRLPQIAPAGFVKSICQRRTQQFGQVLAAIGFRDIDQGVRRRRVEIGIDKFDCLVHAGGGKNAAR